jgi:2-oxo-4-hydroxy-4-carboxy-5-ureidoimidazoline decarboxylase
VTLDELNRAPVAAAAESLERCCGARAWVETMCAARPFADRAALDAAAGRCAKALGRADWLEAFTHHPRIGDTKELRERFASTRDWAGAEQAGAAAADESVLTALAEGNSAYETRFGYVFIVCATEKTAAEMLALLQARLSNPPEHELTIAAEEQMKITRLRLDKLLSGS